MMRFFCIVCACVFAACGGSQKAAQPESTGSEPAARAGIDIVRASFARMGGIERLRLNGGKLMVQATVNAGGAAFPVVVTIGGPSRFKLEYVLAQVSYVHVGGVCRKTVYGIASRCTVEEEQWLDPVRVMSSLVFPPADAAMLDLSFETKEDKTVSGRTCDIVEMKLRNSNLRLLAAYDKESGLLAEARFPVAGGDGVKHTVRVELGDWREVSGQLAPFRRTMVEGDAVLWDEAADLVDFSLFDERAFAPDTPPITDQPLPADIPERRVTKLDVFGESVEVPAPYPAPGGGPFLGGAPMLLPATETMQMVLKGKLAGAGHLKEALKGGVVAGGREPAGDPSIVLLETPAAPDDPVLMIVYVPLTPSAAKESVPPPPK